MFGFLKAKTTHKRESRKAELMERYNRKVAAGIKGQPLTKWEIHGFKQAEQDVLSMSNRDILKTAVAIERGDFVPLSVAARKFCMVVSSVIWEKLGRIDRMKIRASIYKGKG